MDSSELERTWAARDTGVRVARAAFESAAVRAFARPKATPAPSIVAPRTSRRPRGPGCPRGQGTRNSDQTSQSGDDPPAGQVQDSHPLSNGDVPLPHRDLPTPFACFAPAQRGEDIDAVQFQLLGRLSDQDLTLCLVVVFGFSAQLRAQMIDGIAELVSAARAQGIDATVKPISGDGLMRRGIPGQSIKSVFVVYAGDPPELPKVAS